MKRLLPWLCLLLFSAAARISAHNMPQSAVMLDFGKSDIHAELVLPLQELELSFKEPLLQEPATVLQRYEDRLRAYLLEHVQPVDLQGRPWTVQVDRLWLQLEQTPYDLHATLTLTPPPGSGVRRLRLNYSVINHEVMSHAAIVTVRSDWNNAVFSGNPETLGMVQFTITGIDIDRTQGSWTTGFDVVFRAGMRHIAEGTDHLLFLLVLLVPAPLLAVHRVWSGRKPVRRTLADLLRIVTAFTLGHSLTLALGGTGLVSLRAQWVEVLVAFSILVSAAHAIRPLFAGRELYIAGGFGLVHGLAFASSLSQFGFTAWYKALTILSFNLGVEAMQLGIVVCVIPWLILLSRTEVYRFFRGTAASFAGVAALGWIGNRALGLPNPIEPAVDFLFRPAGWATVAGALGLALLVQWTARSSKAPPARPEGNPGT